ncbi:ABC transporter permease [bacterium]|nr:ABC transporter permease [bacterium]
MKKFFGFLKKETIALLRDPVLMAAVMIMPAVQLVVLSGAITLEAQNLRLAVDSGTNDVMIEKIYNHAIGSGWFVRAPDTDKDAVRAVQTGAADVAIVAPDGGLTRGGMRDGAVVQVLIDSMNILKAQSIEAYLQGVAAHAMLESNIAPAAQPIVFDIRILFNPQLNTKWFMVPAMIAILVFIAILVLITISIAKEKESGTIETLMSYPISKYDIIVGKVVPYILMSFLIMLSILFMGLIVFHLPFIGSGLMFVLGFLAFCVPASAVAVLLAAYTRNQQQALLGIVIVAFLALMLSGALVPTENMPLILQYISQINPLSHYSYMVRSIILKGPDWSYFACHAFVMVIVGIGVWIIAIKKFKTTL